MSSKTVPISARISHEDAEFISQLKINDATTPSDKLRAIIADTKRRKKRDQDYRGCFQMIQEIMIPVVEKIREAELENHVHSALITRCVEWLPDTLAYVVSSAPRSIGDKTSEQLDHLERGIADRVFRLMESVLQMGITQRCPCYDADAIAQRVTPILELAQVIKDTSNRERKEGPQ
jgi:hypothetical protein